MALKYCDRKGTSCVKWDGMENNFSGTDLIPMWIADMDFEEADCIKDALRNYVENVPFGYYKTPDSFYEAFINWEKTYHGYEVEREWICYSPGVVPAFNWGLLMLTEPGDSVILLTPVYYPMINAIRDNDRNPVLCALERDGMDYRINFAKFESDIVKNDVKLFIFCSPQNPIGRIWTEEEIRTLMDICRKHGVYVISDEIHADFEWGGHRHVPTATVGDYDDMLITMCAVSKTFNLAACQNSMIIIPDIELRARYKNFAKRIDVQNGNAFGYIACEAAMRYGRPWFEEVKEMIYGNYLYVRDRFAAEVPDVGIADLQGTYLLWMDFSRYFSKKETLEDFMENKCKIAFDYGSWFFGQEFAPFVRMNLATSREIVIEACTRLITELKKL